MFISKRLNVVENEMNRAGEERQEFVDTQCDIAVEQGVRGDFEEIQDHNVAIRSKHNVLQ